MTSRDLIDVVEVVEKWTGNAAEFPTWTSISTSLANYENDNFDTAPVRQYTLESSHAPDLNRHRCCCVPGGCVPSWPQGRLHIYGDLRRGHHFVSSPKLPSLGVYMDVARWSTEEKDKNGGCRLVPQALDAKRPNHRGLYAAKLVSLLKTGEKEGEHCLVCHMVAF